MGLFGGSFTTGLASGLATSVGTAIKDDMERRETRLDKLRTFYETRQVQEQDRAKAEDKRTENHLTRLRNEAGIGAAEVVALYKGLGGTNDSLDRHFSTVDTNKDLGGTTFDYTDMLKNSGVDLSQYGNFTMQDALDNFRYEISAPDINYTEAPSMLSALGLKQDSDKVSASLTRDMQDLVPNVSRIDSGIKSMAMPEGFYSGTEQALKAKADRTEYDLNDRVGVANEAVQAAQNLIYKIKDSEKNLSPEEYEEQLAEANLALERATKRQKGAIKLAQTVSTMTNRADIISLPLRAGVYEKAKKALDDSIQFGGVGDKASAIIVEGDTFTTITGVEKKAGDELMGEDAAKYRAEKQYDYDYDLVANTLTDDAGEFVEGSAKLMMEDGLNLISNSVYLDYLKTIGKEDTTPPVVPGGGTTPVVLTPDNSLGAINAIVANSYEGQEFTGADYESIEKTLIGSGLTKEGAAQAVENYKVQEAAQKEKDQYNSLDKEAKMAFADTAFDEFITPTAEGVSPLTMNEDVIALVERAKISPASFSDESKVALKVLNNFLVTKLYRTKEQAEALRNNPRYNEMRRNILTSITNIVSEARELYLNEQEKNAGEQKKIDAREKIKIKQMQQEIL